MSFDYGSSSSVELPLGLAHAVKISRDFIGDEAFVMYLGDNLLNKGITQFVREFDRRKPAAQILLTRVPDPQMFGFAELEGTARGNPALHAGTAVKVVGVGEQFAGKYVLTSTRHDFSPEHGYRTSFSASNRSERPPSSFQQGVPTDRPTRYQTATSSVHGRPPWKSTVSQTSRTISVLSWSTPTRRLSSSPRSASR